MIQESQLFAVYNSAHRVMKAESVLKRHGMDIKLVPAPRALSTDCGLALCYSNELYDSIMQILTSENILPAYIYRKKDTSRFDLVWSDENAESSHY